MLNQLYFYLRRVTIDVHFTILNMFQRIFLSLFLFKCVFSVEKNYHQHNLNICGGDYSGHEYTITSPNYPQNYPENVDCIYVIRGSPLCNQPFNLQFLDFSLKPSENCQGDFVEIGDKSLFCGNVGGIRRYSGNNNTLRIRFHSSKSENGGVGKGFKISVTTLPCPSEQHNSTLNLMKSNDKREDDNSIPEVQPLTDEPPITSHRHQYEPLYPVYRPQSPFTAEEPTRQFSTFKNLLSTSSSKLFTDNKKLEVVTGKSVNTDFTKPVRISAYFFASPESETSPKLSYSSQQLSEQLPPTHAKTPPFISTQSDQLPATSQEASTVTSIESQLSRLEDTKKLNEKIGIPASAYGLPGSTLLPDIKPGEVLDNTRDVDCFSKANINIGQEFSLGHNYPPNVFAPAVSYPATIYGQPGSSFPQQSTNLAPLPPTHYLPSVPRPNGFTPTRNPENYFPGIGTRVGQCCSNLYSAPRFLLSSPGFPTLLYSGNSYQCGYTIAPHSPNVCRLRFNFKFFNLGSEDPLCNNGHLEIDGRRYCGCKTGLSVVSNAPNLVKGIGVRYVGLPKTKLNGFLIEVIQESCSYNGYPQLSRSKKDVGRIDDDTDDHQRLNDTVVRIKRNLGYSYPKPNIPFEHPGGQVHAGGIGHVGFTSSTRCHALSLIDWTLAAKEAVLKGVRCTSGGANGGGWVPNYPKYPGGRYLPPNYPGNGNGIPNYPGWGSFPPNYPNNGNGFPGYPGIGNGLPNYPEYPGIGNGLPNYPPPSNWIPPNSGACETISVLEGVLSSPCYPNPYPNNVNKCWRFYRPPNGCRLQLSFLDFDVEPSQGCIKDYFSISHQNTRYCGRTLAGSKTLLGFPMSNIIEIRFNSDDYGTGKGFTIGFSQIPCQVEVNR